MELNSKSDWSIMLRCTVETLLQTLKGEAFDSRWTNVRDDLKFDISARGFWTKYQMAFFDAKVFDPNAKRYESRSLQNCYGTNEVEKKRKYNNRIQQVENVSFTPLVFSINGGIEKEANKCYSWIAKKLAEKRDELYSMVVSWIRKKNILFHDEINHHVHS